MDVCRDTIGMEGSVQMSRDILGVPYPRSPATLSLSHMNEIHDPEVQMVMGFMAWLGDQSSPSPGSQPQNPLFCQRAPAL